MDSSRLSLAVRGAYTHALGDVTPIDICYGETIDSPDLPPRKMLVVSGRTELRSADCEDPRAVLIQNVSNQGTQTMPTADELAAMRRRVLLVGFNEDPTPALELPPMIPGEQPYSCGQLLWLASGATVWLDTLDGAQAVARVVFFPRNSNGR